MVISNGRFLKKELSYLTFEYQKPIPKINEIRFLAKQSDGFVSRISEFKLGSSILTIQGREVELHVIVEGP